MKRNKQKTIKVITLQHKSVLECILKNGIYENTNKSLYKTKNIMYNKYLSLSKILKYKKNSIPIFGLCVGTQGVAYGAGTGSNDILIELNIPKEIVSFQFFDDWDEYMSDIGNIRLCDTFIKYGYTKEYSLLDFQTIIPYIKKEWVSDTSDEYYTIKAFIYRHINTASGSKVMTIQDYRNFGNMIKEEENKKLN